MIRVVGKSKLPDAVMSDEQPPPEEVAAAHRRRAIFERNAHWYDAHCRELFEQYRGLHICIAGGEVFADADPIAARARSAAAHPDEAGCQFALYLRPRIEVRG